MVARALFCYIGCVGRFLTDATQKSHKAVSKISLIVHYLKGHNFYFSAVRKNSGHKVHLFNPIMHCISEHTNYNHSTARIPIMLCED